MSVVDEEGATVLHMSTSIGNLAATTLLLKAGANLHAATPSGDTPLNLAALNGHLAVVRALVSAGAEVIATNSEGFTPLHQASDQGYSEVVTALAKAGADPNAMTPEGVTPLHQAANRGYLEVATALLTAGADIEAASSLGSRPLHLAVQGGFSAVVSALVDAGAIFDTRLPFGSTLLYSAASRGHLDTVRVLLLAKADPLLTTTDQQSGATFVPLDVASQRGHVEVVRELVQQVGIEGCGGASDGADALRKAAEKQHLDVMALLVDAGVVDTGKALNAAVGTGNEDAVKLLLHKNEGNNADGAVCVSTRDRVCATTLLLAACSGRCSSRVVRLLVDTGADTASTGTVVIGTPGAEVISHLSPLDATNHNLREKKVGREDATEEQLHGLEGVRRLLMRVDAVHAVSWLWHNAVPIIERAPETPRRGMTASTSLTMMLPALRRRTSRRRRVLLRALFRSVEMSC